MARSKESKFTLGEEFAERFNKASASVVAEYRGITSEELTSLRVELRKVDCEFKVMKNRVAKKAIELKADSAAPISEQLVGPVGVTYMYGDVAAGAKALLKFASENKKLKVKGGVLDGSAMTADEIKALSELPSKEVLLGQIVGSIIAPHRGLMHVLNGVGTNLVRVLNAIKDTKS